MPKQVHYFGLTNIQTNGLFMPIPLFFITIAYFVSVVYGQGGVKLDLNADGSKVTKAWFSKKLDSRIGAAVVVNGYIYGSGDNTRDWQCTDWKTGEQKYAS